MDLSGWNRASPAPPHWGGPKRTEALPACNTPQNEDVSIIRQTVNSVSMRGVFFFFHNCREIFNHDNFFFFFVLCVSTCVCVWLLFFLPRTPMRLHFASPDSVFRGRRIGGSRRRRHICAMKRKKKEEEEEGGVTK